MNVPISFAPVAGKWLTPQGLAQASASAACCTQVAPAPSVVATDAGIASVVTAARFTPKSKTYDSRPPKSRRGWPSP